MNFLARRLLTYLVVFLVVLNITFFLPRLVPGNAAQIFASGTKMPTVAAAVAAARFGLNQPEYVQYIDFLKNIFLTWPPYMGISYAYYPATVTSLFADRVGWTLLLVISALILGTFWTYLLGEYSALRRGGKFEIGALYTSITIQSIPVFWISMILLYTFSITVRVFPLFGSIGFGVGSGLAYYSSIAWHSVLPIIVLSLSLMGASYPILRGSTQDVLKSNYVTAAKSRGLSDWVISTGYILRNSLLPLIAVLSFSLAGLIAREVLVEVVFGYPGVGDLLVDAVAGRDYPVVTGSFFYLTLMVIASGIIGDLVLRRMDPRLRD